MRRISRLLVSSTTEAGSAGSLTVHSRIRVWWSDTAKARQIHHRLLPLFDALFCESNPIPLKSALSMMGLMDDEIRLPLLPLTQPNRERLNLVLKELGFL